MQLFLRLNPVFTKCLSYEFQSSQGDKVSISSYYKRYGLIPNTIIVLLPFDIVLDACNGLNQDKAPEIKKEDLVLFSLLLLFKFYNI